MTYTFNKVTLTPDEFANWQSQWTASQWCDIRGALEFVRQQLAPFGGIGPDAEALYDSTIFYIACCDYRAQRAGERLFGDGDRVTVTIYDVKREGRHGQRATMATNP